jgi:hypothetical protein
MKKESSKKLQLVKIKISSLKETTETKNITSPTTTVLHTFDCRMK